MNECKPLAADRRAAYRAAAEEEYGALAAADEAREHLRVQSVHAFAKTMVTAVASLAQRCAEYRSASDALVPRKAGVYIRPLLSST